MFQVCPVQDRSKSQRDSHYDQPDSSLIMRVYLPIFFEQMLRLKTCFKVLCSHEIRPRHSLRLRTMLWLVLRLRVAEKIRSTALEYLPPDPGLLTAPHDALAPVTSAVMNLTPFLQRLVGTLFVGYTGSPLLTEQCSETSCLQRTTPSVSVTYYFPQWLLQRAIIFSFANSVTPSARSRYPECLLMIRISSISSDPEIWMGFVYSFQRSSIAIRYMLY